MIKIIYLITILGSIASALKICFNEKTPMVLSFSETKEEEISDNEDNEFFLPFGFEEDLQKPNTKSSVDPNKFSLLYLPNSGFRADYYSKKHPIKLTNIEVKFATDYITNTNKNQKLNFKWKLNSRKKLEEIEREQNERFLSSNIKKHTKRITLSGQRKKELVYEIITNVQWFEYSFKDEEFSINDISIEKETESTGIPRGLSCSVIAKYTDISLFITLGASSSSPGKTKRVGVKKFRFHNLVSQIAQFKIYPSSKYSFPSAHRDFLRLFDKAWKPSGASWEIKIEADNVAFSASNILPAWKKDISLWNKGTFPNKLLRKYRDGSLEQGQNLNACSEGAGKGGDSRTKRAESILIILLVALGCSTIAFCFLRNRKVKVSRRKKERRKGEKGFRNVNKF